MGASMFCQITIDKWNDSQTLLGSMKENVAIWVFRGQGDKRWPLKTKFERDAERYKCTGYFYYNRETYMLREFQRGAHRYEQKLPILEDSVEWLSYLQHYGGSTRLLDFTDSFYVAAFFAMEDSTVDSAVWAVNINKLAESLQLAGTDNHSRLYQLIADKHKEVANDCIKSKNESEDRVLVIDPFFQHERVWSQQGSFLFPCNRKSSFEVNLCATFRLPINSLNARNAKKIGVTKLEQVDFKDVAILKIVIPKTLHPKALYELRDMNVTPATLFPGLDGFARSLNLHMRRFEEFF
jgi:hypothetical protein